MTSYNNHLNTQQYAKRHLRQVLTPLRPRSCGGASGAGWRSGWRETWRNQLAQSNTPSGAAAGKPTHIRYLILFLLFVVTTVNYADRATLSIAGSAMKTELSLYPVTMG